MKYKFELWKYGIFDYAEAEEHLNQMAEKGWMYTGMANVYGLIGVYEKNDRAYRTQYAVDIFGTIDKEKRSENLQLFKESGWELIQPELYSEQRIFRAEKEPGIVVPYNDQESKVESISEGLAQGMEAFSRVFCAALGLLLVYIFENPEEDPVLNAIGATIVAYCSLMIIVTLVNSLSFARIHKGITKGATIHRTVLEKNLSSLAEIVSNGKSIFMFCAMTALAIWSMTMAATDNPIDAKNMVLMVVALADLFLTAIKIKKLAVKGGKDIRTQLEGTFSTGTLICMFLFMLPMWI